ncbi:MAG: SDR family NAD(P)-dependent oxidoreductase [Anaerolineae bacterium]|nr:SDR family NAD(P)-dependent oxidoreductase [Anaerolineae bacterium]
MTQGQRVLVTGAAGFTGGHLARRLVADGYRVRTLIRSESQAAELNQAGIETVKGDLRDRDSLVAAMKDIDTVYHIAALYRSASATDQDMWDVNAEGARNMLDAAIANNVRRYVHCSTCGVHGDVKNPPANEDAPFNPGDAYQESKLAGEKIAQEYMHAGKLPIAIFRPAGIYGPGDMRFLKLVKSIKKGRFMMIGSGNILYHMIYIDDLVDGIILCGTKDEAVGHIYLLAGNEKDNITLNHLVALIAELTGGSVPSFHIPFAPVYYAGYACELICAPLKIAPPLYRRRVDFFRKVRAFDSSRARKQLGFSPKFDLRNGLTQTIAWYSANHLL